MLGPCTPAPEAADAVHHAIMAFTSCNSYCTHQYPSSASTMSAFYSIPALHILHFPPSSPELIVATETTPRGPCPPASSPLILPHHHRCHAFPPPPLFLGSYTIPLPTFIHQLLAYGFALDTSPSCSPAAIGPRRC